MGDAFSAGVRPGGLYSYQEIKILICYMLMGVPAPLPRKDVLDIIAGEEMANFFEAGGAIDELIGLGHLNEQPEGLVLTETGKQVATTLSSRIPYTLREKSVKAALRLLMRKQRERDNTVTIEKREHGTDVICTIHEADEALMTLSIRVADDLQANLIKEKFMDNPTLLYQGVLAILTGKTRPAFDGNSILMELR